MARKNLINTMAVGLTRWIKEEEDGSIEPSKVTASDRILNCYVAQLKEKIDETVTGLKHTGGMPLTGLVVDGHRPPDGVGGNFPAMSAGGYL